MANTETKKQDLANLELVANKVKTYTDTIDKDNAKLSKSNTFTGDTNAFKSISASQVTLGSVSSNYFQCRKFRGEGDANTYYHAIDFGYSGHNQVDFYEYGGVWNFWKNTASTAGGTKVASLQEGKLVERGNTLTYPGKSGTIALTSDVDTKQDKLTAGDNITIVDGVISAKGGGTGDVTQAQLNEEISARKSGDTVLQTNIDTEVTRAKGVESGLATRLTTAEKDIDTIESKIPTEASSTNQLADKDFVNSSISTATATFQGTKETKAEIKLLKGDLNDYCYLVVKDSTTGLVKQYDRYKYTDEVSTETGNWVFEYTLNNSSFTAEQWASITSGITSALVAQIGTNKTNIATNTSNLSSHTSNKSNPHGVTKVQVGLGNVDNTSDASLLTALSNSNNGVSITVGGTTKTISNISAGEINKTCGTTFEATNLIKVTGTTDGYQLAVRALTSGNLEVMHILTDDVSTKEVWYGNATPLMTLQPTGSGTSVTGGNLSVNGGLISSTLTVSGDGKIGGALEVSGNNTVTGWISAKSKVITPVLNNGGDIKVPTQSGTIALSADVDSKFSSINVKISSSASSSNQLLSKSEIVTLIGSAIDERVGALLEAEY